MMKCTSSTEKGTNLECFESNPSETLVFQSEKTNNFITPDQNTDDKRNLVKEEHKTNCEKEVNDENIKNQDDETENVKDDEKKPAILFDMFGDMNIAELNFEELDPTCASVDSLLFDNFPQQINGEPCDKVKTEKLSSSSLSCNSVAHIEDDQLNNKTENHLGDSFLSSFDNDSNEVVLRDELEVDMPLLTLEASTSGTNPEMNKMCDSASSESNPTDFKIQADLISGNPFHNFQAQQIVQNSNPQLRQISQHEISPAYFQQAMLNEDMLASMIQSQVAGYPQNSPMLQHYHSHMLQGVQGPYYGHNSLVSAQHGVTYDSLGMYQARVGGESSGKKGSNSKRYKLTHPSKFCHVCVRSGDQVRLAPCANVTSGLCRKAVCEKCFEKHGFAQEWTSASYNYTIIAEMNNKIRDTLPEHAWTCFHCRSQCPPTAQCKIYARTNKRRHNQLKQKKAEKERAAAERTTAPGPGSIIKSGRKVITTARG